MIHNKILQMIPYNNYPHQSPVNHDCPSSKPEQLGMSRNQLFRVAYIPFVMANVVVDWADTICNQAAAAQLKETKKLSREIRSCIREYEQSRQIHCLAQYREKEDNHAIELQEAWFGKYFSELNTELQNHIRYCYPSLSTDMRYLFVSCYTCMIILQALEDYIEWCDNLIKEYYPARQKTMMPQPVKNLRKYVPSFISKYSSILSKQDLQPMVDALVELLHSIEFIDNLEINESQTHQI
jgi:hypothetical protein